MRAFYEDAFVTIFHGDNREILPSLGRFDLLLTDPPYEMTAKGGGIGAQRQYLQDIEGFTDCGFDDSVLDACENWISFCSLAQVPKLIEKAAVRRWMLCTWNKPNPTPLLNGNYLPDTEYIVHSFPSNRLCGGYESRARFIVHPSQQHNLHPNEKPIAVVSKFILVGSEIGQTIVDPFAGSGTTGRAAKDLGRKCILIEREERYCEVAARRMEQEVLVFPVAGSGSRGDFQQMEMVGAERSKFQVPEVPSLKAAEVMP